MSSAATDPGGETAMAERPASMNSAVRLCAVLVGVGLLTVVLAVLLRDDLVRSWAEGRPDERRLLLAGGLDAVRAGSVHPPAFVALAIVLFVVVAGLIWVLVAFLRSGFGWARVALSALLVIVGVGSASTLRTGPPLLFTALCLVSVAVEVAALVQLWRRDTGRFLRGS